LFYYLRIGRAIYIAPVAEDAPELEVGLPTGLAIGIALAGVIGMGVLPGPFIELARQAAEGLLGQ
jgi:NADH:ubiquinone oxidoreductase subunit 2 (subunit N)